MNDEERQWQETVAFLNAQREARHDLWRRIISWSAMIFLALYLLGVISP